MPPRKAQQQGEPDNSKSTISGHQGKWVPLSEQLVTRDIWCSKRIPVDAWRVLWWLTNRMTGNVKFEDDPNIYGIVAGGNPVSFKDIGKTLHPSDPKFGWRSIQRAAKWLEGNALITRSRTGKGQEYCYSVVNSIRQFPLVTTATTNFNIEDEDDDLV